MRAYNWKDKFSEEEMELLRKKTAGKTNKNAILFTKMIEILNMYDDLLCEMDAERRDQKDAYMDWWIK